MAQRACQHAQHQQWAIRTRKLDHDMRTPLGAMTSALELMKVANDDAALQSEAMAVINRQVERLTLLTGELHRIAREMRA